MKFKNGNKTPATAIRKIILTKAEIQSIDKKYSARLQKLLKEFEHECFLLQKKAKDKFLTRS